MNDPIEEFKYNAKTYLNIDNEINKLKDLLKQKKLQKQELQNYIIGFMGKHKLKDLNTQDGKLKYTVIKSKKPLTKTSIHSTLKKYFNNNDDKAKELTNILYSNREKIEKIELKRFFNKKKK